MRRAAVIFLQPCEVRELAERRDVTLTQVKDKTGQKAQWEMHDQFFHSAGSPSNDINCTITLWMESSVF